MRWVIALAALALAACDGGTPKAADGYSFESANFERDDINVRIIQYDNRASFERAARALGVKPDGLMAFGEVGAQIPWCRIHIMRVHRFYQPEWLGHEMTHCIYGEWHHGQEHGI